MLYASERVVGVGSEMLCVLQPPADASSSSCSFAATSMRLPLPHLLRAENDCDDCLGNDGEHPMAHRIALFSLSPVLLSHGRQPVA